MEIEMEIAAEEHGKEIPPDAWYPTAHRAVQIVEADHEADRVAGRGIEAEILQIMRKEEKL